MIDTKNIFRFWAKLPHEKNSPKEFHPLICHMLDVAAATSEIWQQTLSANARQSVAKAFGLDISQTKVWIMFLAALHDLGKASPAFQLRPEAKHLVKTTLKMGEPPVGIKASDIPHGRVTAKELPDILKQELNLNKKLACQLAKIIGGHHGSFPTSNELIQQYPLDGAGKTPWKKVREEFVKLLISFFKLNEITLSDEIIKIDHGVSMIIAGLVSVADWVGSNSDFFPYQVDDYHKVNEITFDISVYLQTAQNQAQKALKQLGWLGWSQPAETASFEQIFPKLAQRRPLQDAVIELATKVSSPSIVIVEAPMGEGKTEAALYLADNWGIAPGPRGFYIALPTQATSNQMFSRTKQFLKDRYSNQPVHLQLLHGHASLSAEFKLMLNEGHKIFQLNGIHSDDDKNCCTYEEMNVIAAEWFTHRKRGLLAPFGVGTVDQALLATLQTRHVFVRLFGLSHKTIIIDEVHAYDAYMSQLLERLLEWLAVMGSPVVLLSATLPKSRRAALLAAYYRGLHLTDSLPDTSKLTQSYPCISWASSAEINGQTIAVSEQISRTLKINWVNGQLPNEQNKNFELGETLKQALETGGCAAVICNTVARAQQVYTALKTYFADNELYLFHARYFFKDRHARERQALEIFGKDPETNTVLNTNRPFRAVLVATQVVEQSLDLDFDLMVTDIAPVDLILQRSGRLHRHLRERPTKLSTPTLWICRPENSANVPEFDYATALIYDKHILLRTWLSLNNLDKVQIPNDIENLIESAYNPELACPTTLSEELQKAWQTTLAEQKKELQENKALAECAMIPEPQEEDNILDKCYQNLKEDKPEIHPTFQALTRLSEPSVSVVLLMPNQYQEHNLEEAPNLEQTKYFLEYSLSLQQRGLVQKLLAQEVPKGWQKSTLLRNHRLIKLDSSGRWQDTENKHEIVLDLELGIVVNNLKYTKSRS